MNQKLLVITIALLIAACGSKNVNNETFQTGMPKPMYPGYVEYKERSYSESYGGILERMNLDFEFDYKSVFGKKTDGTIINETKVVLPDVEVVMHPKFTSDDKIAAFLSEKGAVIPSKGDESLSVLAVKASMPSSKLKTVVHTQVFEKVVLESDIDKIQALYQSVFNVSKSYESLVIVPAWKDSTISADMSKRLYSLFFKEALAAAKANDELNIKLFVSSKEQEDFMKAAWDVLTKEIGIDSPQAKKWTSVGGGSSSSSSTTLTRLSMGSDVVNMSQGSATISGAATNLGDVRFMGVFAEGSARNNRSTLMVGFPVGNHMVAVGTELGFENKELSYSAAKLLATMSATESLKFSAAISSVNEKVSMFFNQLNRSGVMFELGAHYNEQISQDVSVSINGGLRGLYSSQLEMGWFGQVSLDVGLFKAATFVSSVEAGLNFGVEY